MTPDYGGQKIRNLLPQGAPVPPPLCSEMGENHNYPYGECRNDDRPVQWKDGKWVPVGPSNLASQAGQPWNEAVHGPAAAAYATHYDKEARWLEERGKKLSAMAAKYGMPVSGPPRPSARTPAQQATWEASEKERIRLSGKR